MIEGLILGLVECFFKLTLFCSLKPFTSLRKLKKKEKSAEKVDRTPDLMIFSHTLSQLSYLGT